MRYLTAICTAITLSAMATASAQSAEQYGQGNSLGNSGGHSQGKTRGLNDLQRHDWHVGNGVFRNLNWVTRDYGAPQQNQSYDEGSARGGGGSDNRNKW